MEVGEYYEANHTKIATLSDKDWRVALAKCKKHIRWRLRQRTLFGAHSPSNLGADPIDYYLGIAYEKILAGKWEWKEEYSLSEQMIRIANKFISDEVVKFKSEKGQSFKLVYKDIEEEFYGLANAPPEIDEAEYEEKLRTIEAAVAEDSQLSIMVEALKEGHKRSDIAALLDIQPRQLDKLKEKLERKVKNYNPSV